MSTARPTDALDVRLRTLSHTIRWAPAPRWGSTTGERARYTGYLSGSIIGWTVAGLGMAALIGRALAG